MRTSPLHHHLSPFLASAKTFRLALRTTTLWGMFLCLCLAAPLGAQTQPDQWRWMSGSITVNQPGVYGARGVYAPGSRSYAVSWRDTSGNLWLFGGNGIDSAGNGGDLNDLWEYNPSNGPTGQWSWMGGSSTVNQPGVYGPTPGACSTSYVPGGREGAVGWRDASGNFWLFGGFGVDSASNQNDLNDLWEYNPSNGQWCWMGGNNTGGQSGIYGPQGAYGSNYVPGARGYGVSWRDASGNLWLFGGSGYSPDVQGWLNDLWEYKPSTGQWCWMGGSPTSPWGVYGTQGVYAPGSRSNAVSWRDARGNLWLFGGWGYSTDSFGYLNDLWEYSPSDGPTGQWSWMGGSSAVNQPGVYGAPGTPVPGARVGAVSWRDIGGNLWLFGGAGYDSTDNGGWLNDLWEYNPYNGPTGQWIWMGGSNTANQPGGYPTLGVYAADNVPVGRDLAVSWRDASGNFWLFGGNAQGSGFNWGQLNDLWEYSPAAEPPAPPAITSADSTIFTVPTQGSFTVTATGNPVPTLSESGALPSGVTFYAPTGVLSGTPGTGTGGVYQITLTASNSAGTVTQSFTLTVDEAPAITSANSATFIINALNSFTVTATGYPPPNLSASGMPTWLSFSNGVLSADPSTSDAGTYLITFAASNIAGTANQSFTLLVQSTQAQIGEWRWMDGSSTLGCWLCAVPGVYGVQGYYAPGNVPGGRLGGATWRDASGNFWLFGGFGFDSVGHYGYLNDLWEYNPLTEQWRWMGGSKTMSFEGGCELYFNPGEYGTEEDYNPNNLPGGRVFAVSWSDGSGNLWLFGGGGHDSNGEEGNLNDLWEYNPLTGLWRWMGGSKTANRQGAYGTEYAAGNVPGSREAAVSWSDGSGNFWLFGGDGYDSFGNFVEFNDLWEYSLSLNQWRCVGGSSTFNQPGAYSTTPGIPGVGNVPGSRDYAVGWRDGSGNFWLFGGYGYDSAGNFDYLNDLWEYNPSNGPPGQWTWVGGSSTIDQPGMYGTPGLYAADNVPGARGIAVSWSDASGNLWLFGGQDPYQDYLNDLWEYDLSNGPPGQWRWMSGSSTGWQPGVYGTLGVFAAGNVPGGRAGPAGWSDGSGTLWLFGGYGLDSVGTQGQLNDLWEYNESPVAPAITSASSTIFVVGTSNSFIVTATGSPAPTLSESGTLPSGVTFDASTGVLSGTPGTGTGGVYPITFTASNGISPDATQSFTLTVDQAPAITSANSATFIIGATGSFTVLATGYPQPNLSASGMPTWLSFSNGVLSADPSTSDAGAYPITFTASNIAGEATQNFILWVVPAQTQPGEWRWMSGSSTVGNTGGQPGVYGTLYASSVGNVPGGRWSAVSWTDASGNFWLFGGYGYDSGDNGGLLNDLWEYNPSAGPNGQQWSWVSGSKTVNQLGVYGGVQGFYTNENVPGARDGAVSWLDANGNLWLFGGFGYDSAGNQGRLNDLWEYNPLTEQWRWMGSSNTINQIGQYGTQGVYGLGNVPGGREYAVSWTDASGNLWLFGGWGYDSAGNQGYLNDLWEYNPSIGPTGQQWRWMGGSKTVNQLGVYGTQQGLYPSGNVPGGRAEAVSWSDGSGNLWLFGGSNGAFLNDLWEYNPSLEQWRWVGGSSTVNQLGVYGTQGDYASGNVPGGRLRAVGWSDSYGNLWLFGGMGYYSAAAPGLLNDLWEYNLSSGLWRWMSGSSTVNEHGVYGMQGIYAPGSVPGGRAPAAASWTDASGNLWLFGGNGYDSLSNRGQLNDLWEYGLAVEWGAAAPAITSAGTATFIIGTGGLFRLVATGYPQPTLSEIGSLPGGVTFDASTGVLSGAPAAGTTGNYPITFTASNGVSPDATQSFTLTVEGATPALTLICPEAAYDGNAHSCMGTATGLGGAAVTGSWSFSPGTETNAGSYSETSTFTSSDPNYVSGGTVSGTLKIDAATPALTLTCPEVAYNGNAHSCTGTATGVGGAAVSGTWSFSLGSETNAGSYSETGTFTSSDPNYVSGGTASGTLRIDEAPTITSANSATFIINALNSFTVTATGYPPPNLSASGVPTWLSFSNGVLSGAPAAGTAGSYPISLTASNGVGPNATQSFILIVAPITNCQFTLTSTTTTPATVTTLTNMPGAAYYGDTVTISGCQARNPKAKLTYALAGSGLKSTLVSSKVTFKATEAVAVTISAAASGKYPAVSWTTAATTVNLRPVSIQASSPTWTYGQTPPATKAIKFALAAGSAPLAFSSDKVPATGPYYTLTDSGNNNVTTTPANQLPIGAYTITPSAAAIQASGYLPYYTITPVAGTLTVAPNNTSGSKGVVKPGTTSISLAGIEVGTSGTVTVLVTNMSGETLNLGASLPAGAPWSVSAAPVCANTSGSGGVCSFTLTFAPTAAGAATSTLTITAVDANPDQFTGTTFTVAPVMLKLTVVN